MKVVVVLVDLELIDLFREEERLVVKDGVLVEVLMLSFDVVWENFEWDLIVLYDSRVCVRFVNFIFGMGVYGDVLEVKEVVVKVNVLFCYIDYFY